MPSSTTELIKEKIDVVEFLKGYLTLQPAGKNFKALCPFHKEKTASFMISPERQSWHCFGCGLGGDIFGFLMRYENLEFGDALRVLAERAGIELRRLDPAEHKYTGLLYELNNEAKEFFKKSLAASEPAKKYLAERGLKPETIEEFELGWAPNAPEALTIKFLNSHYAPDDIVRAGLAIKTERGMLLDRFRGRIMFPIHNHLGKVVGFTGRVLPQFENAEMGKYVNSPETPIFQKSRLLYGFFNSKNNIRESGSVFMVEGQMDFLMSWQTGVKNAVATSGTALTPDHLRNLRRVADEIILSFDTDEAGSAAAERAIDLAEASDFNVKVASFAGFKDPAEAAQADPENFRKTIENSIAAPKFYFEKYLPAQVGAPAGRDLPNDRRKNLKNLRIILAKLKNIASPVERGFWLKELSKKTGVEEGILTEEMERIKTASSPDKTHEESSENNEIADVNNRRYSRRELISEELLRAVVAKNDFAFLNDSSDYLSALHHNILEMLKKGKKSSDDPQIDELMNFIILGAKDLGDEEKSELKRQLLLEHFKDKRQALTSKIRQAEAIGNDAELKLAMEELNGLSAHALES